MSEIFRHVPCGDIQNRACERLCKLANPAFQVSQINVGHVVLGLCVKHFVIDPRWCGTVWKMPGYFCKYVIMLVPTEGVEPTHSFEYQILSLARLPIPPRRPPNGRQYKTGQGEVN